ncbi:unnamed protein product [Boreogadus saida]
MEECSRCRGNTAEGPPPRRCRRRRPGLRVRPDDVRAEFKGIFLRPDSFVRPGSSSSLGRTVCGIGSGEVLFLKRGGYKGQIPGLENPEVMFFTVGASAGDGEHLDLPPNQRDGGHLAAGRRKARSHYKRGYKPEARQRQRHALTAEA